MELDDVEDRLAVSIEEETSSRQLSSRNESLGAAAAGSSVRWI
jgi:hypothetical protein